MNKTKTKISILILSFVIGLGTFWGSVATAQAAYSAGSVITSTNSQRSRNGLGALTSNSQLSAAASAKAQDMFNGQYFAHTSPTGKTPWDFIRGAGYDYTYAGENLAIGYDDISELMSAWMNSPTHRENILSPNFREIGVAVVSGTYEGAETIIVVQEFGTQESAPEEVASETNQNIENTQPTPEPQTTPTPNQQQSQNAQKSFSIIKEKSSFYPQTIYSGEETTIKITLRGEVRSLEAELFGEKINVLEISSVSGSDEKTYTIEKKIEKEGESDVVIKATDKNGISESLNMGKIRVNSTVLTKDISNNQNQGIVGGFKTSLSKYWYLYTIGLGAVLALAWFIFAKRVELGKKLRVRLTLWNL